MLSETLTGATSYNDRKCQVDAGKILVVLNVPTADLSDPTFSIEIKDGGNGTTICKRLALSKLMEFSQNKEGFKRIFVTATHTIIRGYIDLCEFGALSLDQHKYLSIDVENVATTAEIKLYAKSDNEISRTYFEYNRNDTATKDQKLMLAGKEYLLLTKSHVDEVRLTYATGRTQRMPTALLEGDQDDNNDLVSVTTDVVAGTTVAQYGSESIFILGLTKPDGTTNVVSAEITTDGAMVEYILIDSKPL